MMKQYAMGVLALMVGLLQAAPTVGDMKVTPIPPWGLAIDYTVSAATDAEAKGVPGVKVIHDEQTYNAKTLQGDLSFANGAHRIYWNAANDEVIVEAEVAGVRMWSPTESGDYTLTHTVGDVVLSATYHVALSQFEIDDGTGDVGGVASRFSFSGLYDGKGHGLSVDVPNVPNAKVMYSLSKDGPYVDPLLFTNVCTATSVWYVISAPGYQTYTNRATVTILENPTWWCQLVPDGETETVDASTAPTFNGYLYDAEETPVGTLQAKVAKARLNRRTRQGSSSVTVAILVAGEKKISLRGTLDVESGATSLKARDGRLLDLRLGANGLSGTFGDYVIDGARDVFSSKATDDKARANEALAQWKGALAIASDVGTFSVTVASRGKARITGTLSDGTKIATSAQMIVGESCSCIPVVVSKKSVNLAFCIWLDDDGETVEVVGLGDEVTCGRVGALEDGATFCIDVMDLCELLGDDTFAAYLPDGVSVAQKGTKWIVADGARAGKVVLGRDGEIDEDKAGENPSGLKFAYKAKSGSFTGSFKAYVLSRGKPKAVTATVSGVMIDGIGYGTATIRKVGSVAVRIE